MTKALTEQWREGTLNGGYYYLKMKDGNIFIDHTEYIFWAHEIRWETKDSSYVKEVLAPVPRYDEYKELTQRVGRLELDNEVLEDVVKECNKRGLENKKLQEQLKEANDVIKKHTTKHIIQNGQNYQTSYLRFQKIILKSGT